MVERIKNLHTFSITWDKPEGGSVTGEFECRRISIRDTLEINKRRLAYTNGLYYDPETPGVGVDQYSQLLANMSAHLEVVLTKTPDWWDLNEITDVAVVHAVFEEVAAFSASFHRRSNKEAASGELRGSGEGASEEDSEESNPSGEVGTVVVGKVQIASQP